ncbi:SDR family NAD(P)-dependent oxidoreductase [Brevibacterium oceani]|uniref:SDR family NAD(P)-dependent oxidoreductase n=1 Tax=Brevibacterium oceani TaxID=358099 RepID=UPI001B335FB8|nr:SDR family oxidoreductase [Brevibacterium oceani]
MRGKVSLVTGAGSGIGRATALALAENGATIVIADMDFAAAEETAALITAASSDPDTGAAHTAPLALSCDVTRPAEVARVFAAIDDNFGGLDYAVNNAGICTEVGPISDYSLSSFRTMMSVNVMGVFTCLQHEVSAMRRRGGGAIVNLSSIFGQVSGPGYSAYTVTKHAVEGLTKSVALENAEHGIRVNCVRPSVVQTPLMTGKHVNAAPGSKEWSAYENANPTKRNAQPEEIAAAIVWQLSDEASFVSGGGINLDGAYLAR